MALAPNSLFGRYEIRLLLGVGGMGEVYLAWDPQLQRSVALKILRGDVEGEQRRSDRLLQEARAASGLNHPNVVTIYEVGEAGALFIAAEFIEGATLRQYIADRRLELREVLDIGGQIASALAAAHDAGLVHRDIKPENIMRRVDGIIKVVDFGLAKLTEHAPFTSAGEVPTRMVVETKAGTVMGTVRYMSPEQARGLTVDKRSDIWSLGVVLYEMAAWHPPFEGDTPADVIASIMRSNPAPIFAQSSDLAREFDHLVQKALAKEREARYQSAAELDADLRRLRKQLELQEEMPSPRTGRRVVRASSGIASLSPPYRRPARRKTIESLAILPFVNASADPNLDYLSDGISENLIDNLSRLPRLRVMARSTVFRYKGGEVDALAAGRALAVQAIVTGKVSLRQERLLVHVELVNVVDGSQLWGEHYNREFEDIFAVEAQIGEEITEKLRLNLSSGEKQRLKKQGTTGVDAYRAYLKGRFHLSKHSAEGFLKGIDYFGEAIRLDPMYAPAYAGLADSYVWAVIFSILPPRAGFAEAKTATLKALEIDDTLVEAHASRAFAVMCHDWDWTAAERGFQQAIKLNDNFPMAHQWYGQCLAFRGRFAEAQAEMKRALEIDPLSLVHQTLLFLPSFFERQYDDAIEQVQKALEMDANFVSARIFLMWAYAQKAMREQASALCESILSMPEGRFYVWAVAYVYGLIDRPEKARSALDALAEAARGNYISPYHSALIHTVLGEHNEAMQCLEQGYENRDPWLVWLKVDPRLDDLRSYPRYQSLVARVGLAH